MLAWDVTCLDTLALSYSNLVGREAGTVIGDAKGGKKPSITTWRKVIALFLQPLRHWECLVLRHIALLGISATTLQTPLKPLSVYHLWQRIVVVVL